MQSTSHYVTDVITGMERPDLDRCAAFSQDRARRLFRHALDASIYGNRFFPSTAWFVALGVSFCACYQFNELSMRQPNINSVSQAARRSAV